MLKISTKNGELGELVLHGSIGEISADMITLTKAILGALAESEDGMDVVFESFLKDLFLDMVFCDPDEYDDAVKRACRKADERNAAEHFKN